MKNATTTKYTFHSEPEVLQNIKLNASGCNEWQGFIQKSGYGQLKYLGKKWSVHRLFYTLLIGEIPEGLSVLHSCDNRCCCNPDHLRAGTHDENMRDMIERGRNACQKKTHCPRGHEYTPETVCVRPKSGHKYCRICAAELDRARRERHPRSREKRAAIGLAPLEKELGKIHAAGIPCGADRGRWGSIELESNIDISQVTCANCKRLI